MPETDTHTCHFYTNEEERHRPSHDYSPWLQTKLEMLDTEFKTHHFSLINLATEQETLDHHDDVTALTVHIQQVLTMNSATPTHINQRRVLLHKLQHLDKSPSSVNGTVSSLTSHSKGICHHQQHEEQLSDYNNDLADFRNSLVSLDLTEGKELLNPHADLEKRISQDQGAITAAQSYS